MPAAASEAEPVWLRAHHGESAAHSGQARSAAPCLILDLALSSALSMAAAVWSYKGYVLRVLLMQVALRLCCVIAAISASCRLPDTLRPADMKSLQWGRPVALLPSCLSSPLQHRPRLQPHRCQQHAPAHCVCSGCRWPQHSPCRQPACLPRLHTAGHSSRTAISAIPVPETEKERSGVDFPQVLALQ